jgi:hypothetical protein
MLKDDIYKAIDSKVILHSEVVVCLFEHCNMECVFCPQKHDSIVGASREEIISKVSLIVDYVNSNRRSSHFKIHVMGGELFQDRWIERNFLDVYSDFIRHIKEGVNSDKEIEFNFVTNLVFDMTDEVMKFVNDNRLELSVSYDARGRFNSTQYKTFKRNVEIFKHKIRLISCVGTKQNMEAIIEGDEYFDYLYSLFPCDWDSFLPSVSVSEKMMPSEKDLLAFYKHLVDFYPECINISYFTGPEQANKMSCTRGNSFTVMPDGSNPKGCSGSVLLTSPSSNDLFSGAIVEKFINTYNCFQCEFYKKCPFTCFIKNDYSKIKRDLGECVFKETFKYVRDKSQN